MEHAFAFLDKLFEYVWQFVPRPYQIKYNERGVRYRRGNRPVLIKPGFHWYWPMTTTVKVVNITNRAEEFVPTELTTSDDTAVSISYSMVYKVTDPVVADSTVDDYEQTLGELAETALAPFVLNHTYQQLLEATSDIAGKNSFNKRLTRDVRKLMKPYGLTITYCRVRSIAKVRVLKIHTAER